MTETVEKETSSNEKVADIAGRKVKFVKPNIGLSSEADMEYSKAYAAALKNGLPPRVSVQRRLEEDGHWTPTDDQKIDDLTVRMQEIIVELRIEGKTDKEKEDLRKEFSQVDADLAVLDITRRQLFNHTAETKGEEAKLTCLAWQSILNEDGSKIWNSKEEFLNATADEFIGQAVRQFVLFNSNVDSAIDEVVAILGSDESAEKEAAGEPRSDSDSTEETSTPEEGAKVEEEKSE